MWTLWGVVVIVSMMASGVIADVLEGEFGVEVVKELIMECLASLRVAKVEPENNVCFKERGSKCLSYEGDPSVEAL